MTCGSRAWAADLSLLDGNQEMSATPGHCEAAVMRARGPHARLTPEFLAIQDTRRKTTHLQNISAAPDTTSWGTVNIRRRKEKCQFAL